MSALLQKIVNHNALNGWKNKGYDSIIKHDVISKFKKGETAEHDNLVKVLIDLGVTFEDKKYVHPQTLKSFIRAT